MGRALSALDFRRFQIALTGRLLAWAGLSLSAGLALILFGNAFWRSFGIQAMAWGLADALIALLGRLQAVRSKPASGRPQEKLRRILWINTLLDLLYIGCGAALAASLGSRSASWRGHGAGIAVQGLFLAFFDLIHAQSVPPPVPDAAAFQVFAGAEHQPFLLKAETAPAGPAALLVHGFPGTPAEMRPLGLSLQQAGWTARGLLLPGFGPQIATLADRRFEEWRAAVVQELEELGREHSPVLLVGFSLGGALALAAAALASARGAASGPSASGAGRGAPDGLALLAPFWRLASSPQRGLALLLRPFLPRYFYPLKNLDFTAPEARRSLSEFLPQLDLDDPAVADELRRFGVPLSLIREVDRSGRQATGPPPGSTGRC